VYVKSGWAMETRENLKLAGGKTKVKVRKKQKRPLCLNIRVVSSAAAG
jgi:hypothetical protein